MLRHLTLDEKKIAELDGLTLPHQYGSTALVERTEEEAKARTLTPEEKVVETVLQLSREILRQSGRRSDGVMKIDLQPDTELTRRFSNQGFRVVDQSKVADLDQFELASVILFKSARKKGDVVPMVVPSANSEAGGLLRAAVNVWFHDEHGYFPRDAIRKPPLHVVTEKGPRALRLTGLVGVVSVCLSAAAIGVVKGAPIAYKWSTGMVSKWSADSARAAADLQQKRQEVLMQRKRKLDESIATLAITLDSIEKKPLADQLKAISTFHSDKNSEYEGDLISVLLDPPSNESMIAAIDVTKRLLCIDFKRPVNGVAIDLIGVDWTTGPSTHSYSLRDQLSFVMQMNEVPAVQEAAISALIDILKAEHEVSPNGTKRGSYESTAQIKQELSEMSKKTSSSEVKKKIAEFIANYP